jgi:hypothetical protein
MSQEQLSQLIKEALDRANSDNKINQSFVLKYLKERDPSYTLRSTINKHGYQL